MNLRKALGIGSIVLAVGCTDSSLRNPTKIITATPKSINYDANGFDLTMLLEMDGKEIIAETYSNKRDSSRQAAALLAARVHQRQDEPVQFYGYFKQDEFGQTIYHVMSIKSRNYRIDLEQLSENPYELEEETGR